jgi:hypothetical protein
MVPPQRHQLGVVRENLPGHAPEVLEGVHVATRKASRIGPRYELEVAGRRPVQDQAVSVVVDYELARRCAEKLHLPGT